MTAVTLLDTGRVEHRQEGHALIPGVVVVDGPASSALGVSDRQVRPTLAGVESTRQVQQAITEDFSLEAAWIHPPEEMIVRVALLVRVVSPLTPGAHAVRFGHHQESVQVFHAPTRLHKLHGQPVEQLVVDRPGSAQPEVEHRANQRRAEVPRPDVVYSDPRG